MAATPPVCEFDLPAPAFALPATDGKTYSFDDISGPKGTLVMFICNHCPYVLAVLDRIARDARDLAALGIGTAAICSNDPVAYPADSFDNLVRMADEKALPFPYLHDADQSVARAYGAACTPDFFLFDKDHKLVYRGQLDSTRPYRISSGNYDNRNGAANGEDLRAALDALLAGKEIPGEQWPSIGCNIKWKPGNEPAYFG